MAFSVGHIMILLGINLGFFGDEKSFKTSFRMIERSPVPFCVIFVPPGGTKWHFR